jgi:ligand-binding SRPBCC domain-containing protein
MPQITLHTAIHAPREVVFNLSRSIDLHKISAAHTGEEALPAGQTRNMHSRQEGLMQLHDTVTWRARHLGFVQQLTVSITAMHYPHHFTDEMVPGGGAFAAMAHRHVFEEKNGQTIMTDVFYYQSPLGILGRLADVLFLKRYMRNFLVKRNAVIKAFAEDPAKWQQVPRMEG